mgnify:CR=1 FL=1
MNAARCPLSSLALLSALACAPADAGQADLGPIEDVLDASTQARWLGRVGDDGVRTISRLNGFAAGQPVGYWLCGPAPQTSAEIFWFCREGDAACPLDARGAVDFARTIGGPVFSRMPGEQSYSPYWWIRVIRVPEGYAPDAIKSVAGIEAALRAGSARNEWYHFDFGGLAPADKAIEHSLMVLAGTRLAGNGEPLVGQPGTASHHVPVRRGWYRQYRVSFFDFTETEGVFAPALEQDEWARPRMPSAALLVPFRPCAEGSTSAACAQSGPMQGAVDESALARDLTGDGDEVDTNVLVSALPGARGPGLPAYSPLWAVKELYIVAQHDGDLALIDSTGHPFASDLKDAAIVPALIDAGYVAAPVPMSEARTGTNVAGNDGLVFMDGPVQVN